MKTFSEQVKQDRTEKSDGRAMCIVCALAFAGLVLAFISATAPK